MKNIIPIISFFSGGGFMDMGFIEAGFDIVFANLPARAATTSSSSSRVWLM